LFREFIGASYRRKRGQLPEAIREAREESSVGSRR
jgi:hypothetical protein